MNRLALYGIAAMAVAMIIGGAWLSFETLRTENQALAAQNATVTAALVSSEQATQAAVETIGVWSDAQDRLQSTLDDMARNYSAATAETRRLNALFSKHDLERLAHAKPILMERRFNVGTARIYRMLERSTDPDRHGAGKVGATQTAAPAAASGVEPAGDRVDGADPGNR